MTPRRLDSQIVTNSLLVASRAPSLHNTQPWRWRLAADRLDLFLDAARVLRYADPAARQAIISCGAMLHHLCLAMLSTGWEAVVDRFPATADVDHLASLVFAPTEGVTDDDRRRAGAIVRRRTDRRAMRPPPGWDRLEHDLRKQLPDRVRLTVVPDELRGELAETCRLINALQQADGSYANELDWWTTPFSDSGGIPRGGIPAGAASAHVDVSRVFPAGQNTAESENGHQDQATIMVLSTAGDTKEDALACGEALSAVLLTCTATHLATCPVTHVTELVASRDAIATVVRHTGVPQVLIRVGLAAEEPELPVTPRRAVAEILRTDQ